MSAEILYAQNFFYDEGLDSQITIEDVEIVINKTRRKTSLTCEFFKNSSKKYLEEVEKTFNVIFEKGEIDKSFLNSIIYPIHKNGNKSVLSNYGGRNFKLSNCEFCA